MAHRATFTTHTYMHAHAEAYTTTAEVCEFGANETKASTVHFVDGFKRRMHANKFIVELVVAVGVGKERVAERDKQVEDVDNLTA